MNEKLVKFLMNERPNSDRWSIMAKALPKEIDEIVAEIVGIVNKCDPLHLLEKYTGK